MDTEELTRIVHRAEHDMEEAVKASIHAQCHEIVVHLTAAQRRIVDVMRPDNLVEVEIDGVQFAVLLGDDGYGAAEIQAVYVADSSIDIYSFLHESDLRALMDAVEHEWQQRYATDRRAA